MNPQWRGSPLPIGDDHRRRSNKLHDSGNGSKRRHGPFAFAPPEVAAAEASASIEEITVEVIGAKSLDGPLCVFVPSTGDTEEHRRETLRFLDTWGDSSTLLFTLSNDTDWIDNVTHHARAREIHIATANFPRWFNWHFSRVMSSLTLRRRGANPSSIRGRGQLSIPLFHWMSQLVKRNDQLVQHCKWFMKCDTDTYLRRAHLEQLVLHHLDPEQPLHVGVPLWFNTRPFHTTLRKILFEYNLGGPGYTFSRQLLRVVDVSMCVRSMAADPVLLIHDDVGTGYCAAYHAQNSRLAGLRTAMSSTAPGFLWRIMHNSSTCYWNRTFCLGCVTAVHPTPPMMMEMMSGATLPISECLRYPSLLKDCHARVIVGSPAEIGAAWAIDSDYTQYVRDTNTDRTRPGMSQPALTALQAVSDAVRDTEITRLVS